MVASGKKFSREDNIADFADFNKIREIIPAKIVRNAHSRN